MSVGQFAWHVHHDRLVEVLTESIEARQEYIRDAKPEDEIATRLRLLKPVVGELPAAVIDAGRAVTETWGAYIEARRADVKGRVYVEAMRAYAKARMAYGQVLRTHASEPNSELNTLHAQECPDCPWDGRSILGNTQ